MKKQTKNEIEQFFEENKPKKKKFHKESFYPSITLLVLILLSSVSFSFAGFGAFFPLVEIATLYFWTIFNKKLMPNWVVLIAGCLKDIFSASPIGVNAFTMVFLNIIFKRFSSKLKRIDFILIWLGFGVFCLLSMFVKWLLFSFVYGQILPLNFAFLQLFFSISTYPLFHIMLFRINKRIKNNIQNAKQK